MWPLRPCRFQLVSRIDRANLSRRFGPPDGFWTLSWLSERGVYFVDKGALASGPMMATPALTRSPRRFRCRK